MVAAIAEYGDHEPNEYKQNKTIERVLEALIFYTETWPLETDDIQPYFVGKKPAVEFTFSIPLPIQHPVTGQQILYAGRYDLLGMYKGGSLIGVDDKTASQLGASWATGWNLRGQFTGYTWATREYGLPCIGIMVRGVSFLKTKFGNQDSLQLRDDGMVNSWYEQMLHDVKQMVEAYKAGWFSQNFSDSCAAYGGCPMQTTCTTLEPEAWLESNFQRRVWNPLEKHPTKEKGEAVVEEFVALPEGIRTSVS